MHQFVIDNRDLILAIAAKHGALNVRVFGSMARGDADDKSDLDLLVEMGPKRTPFFPGGLIYELSELLHRPIDVVTESGLYSYVKERVMKEAIPL